MDTPKGGELRIFITGPDGQIKAQSSGAGRVTLVYDAPYEEGDVIHMTGGPGFVVALTMVAFPPLPLPNTQNCIMRGI